MQFKISVDKLLMFFLLVSFIRNNKMLRKCKLAKKHYCKSMNKQ